MQVTFSSILKSIGLAPKASPPVNYAKVVSSFYNPLQTPGVVFTSTGPVSVGSGSGYDKPIYISGGGGSTPSIDNLAIQEQQRQQALLDLENARRVAEEKARQQQEAQRQAQLQQQQAYQYQIQQQQQQQVLQRSSLQNIQPTQATKIFLASEYQQRGYSPYEAKILTKQVGMAGLNLSREESQKAIDVYASKHIPEVAIASGFLGAETSSEYQDRLAREQYEKNLKYSIGGDYPSMVRKAFTQAGTKFFSGVSDIYAGITKQQKLPQELKEQGGRTLGTAFLWAGFAPLMKTGTAGEDFEAIGELYGKKKKKQQLISEGRFSELGPELEKISVEKDIFTAKVERELILKTSFKEQKKYLKDLYKNFVRTPEQEAGFRLLVSGLKEKNILKDIVIDISKGGSVITGTPRAYYNVKETLSQIPQMKNIGGITGITSFFKTIKEPPLKITTSNLYDTGSIASLKTSISTQTGKSRQKQEQKELQKTEQALKTIQLQTPSLSQALKQPQKQRQQERQITQQIQKQVTGSLYKQPTQGRERKRFGLYIPFGKNKLMQTGGLFTTSVRRRGKFRPVGIFSSYNKAMEKGLFSTKTTLARSFRITGTPGGAQIPKGFYLSRKEPRVFIQKRKFSLSAPTEKSEIKYFRNLMKMPKQSKSSKKKKGGKRKK